jgi:hypothetical protein
LGLIFESALIIFPVSSVNRSRKRAIIESDEEEEEEELEEAPTVNAENVRAQDANVNSDGEEEEEVGVGYEALEKDEGGQGEAVPKGSDDEAGEGDLGAVGRDHQPAEEDEPVERKKKKQKKKDEGDDCWNPVSTWYDVASLVFLQRNPNARVESLGRRPKCLSHKVGYMFVLSNG